MLRGVRLRYRYRLDPTPAQRKAFARALGCARVVYNDGLRLRQDAHKAGLPFIGDAELSRRVVTLAKQTPERAWLGEVSAVVLQQSLADLSAPSWNYMGVSSALIGLAWAEAARQEAGAPGSGGHGPARAQ